MSTSERLKMFLGECRGRSRGEYTVLAVFWLAGLAAALAAFMGSHLGKVILTASKMG